MKYHNAFSALGILYLSLFLPAVSSQIGRYIEYPSVQCNKTEFRCTNNQCIDEGLICDGHIDCADHSDETRILCLSLARSCNPLAFVCDYGACIDGGLSCDGTANCADNSDERACDGLALSNQNACLSGQFQCNNGECIDDLGTCDGERNCADGSDETEERCRNFECPLLAFKCNYGACVDGDKKCDGQVDCADSSDESLAICNPGVPPPDRPPPVKPLDLDDATNTSTPVSADVKWCEPLTSQSVEGTCSRQGENLFSCDRSVKPGTVAQLSCKADYDLDITDPSRSNTVECVNTGQWQPAPIKCEAQGQPAENKPNNSMGIWFAEILRQIGEMLKGRSSAEKNIDHQRRIY